MKVGSKDKKSMIIILQEVGCCLFIVITIGIVIYQILGLSNLQIDRYPMMYQEGDSVTGMAAVKSMYENGWIYRNPYLGAPGIQENYDAMTMELFYSLIEQVMVKINGNWILTYNLLYLMGYFLVGLTAYYSLRRLDIRKFIAAPSAVIYAFLPYHQMRGTSHMYLGLYFMVPISILFLYRLMNGELIFNKGNRGWVTPHNLLCVAALMIMSLTGVYYTFFTCFFLCVVILYSIMNRRKGDQIKQALISLGVIVGTIICSAIPNFIYWHNNGRSTALNTKGPEGAELYALKIIQLIIPRPGHRLTFFDKVNHFYQVVFPMVNEDNRTASLGIIMSIGFVILCLALFAGNRISEKSLVKIGSIFNISALLFGTVGGFAVIIAFFSGALRCYNRFSVFIAMFSLIAVDEIIQTVWDKWFSRKKWMVVLLGVGMLFLMYCGIYDQTIPQDPGMYDQYAAQYERDEAFVKTIEGMEAQGAMIYQMPYMKYPENGSVNQMPDYAHMSAYLHSSSLRWSYGAAQGRDADDWQKSLNEMSLREQVAAIRSAGFAGIYIDWRAYLPDEKSAFEKILAEEMGAEPIVNSNGTKAYYSFQ